MPENARELRRTKVNIREHKRINLKLFREDQPGIEWTTGAANFRMLAVYLLFLSIVWLS